MFGKKQEYTKELEERLINAESEAEILRDMVTQIEIGTRQMAPCFESQIIAQSDMDKELAKAGGKAREAMEASCDSGDAYEQFAIEFTSMRGQLEEEERKKAELLNVLGRQQKQLETFVEEKDFLAGPLEQLAHAQVQIAETMNLMQEQLGQMRQSARQMSSLALNCAIEAGRLGESGRQFVGAAEDVRQLSGSYEHTAESISSQLEGIQDVMEQLKQQTGGLVEVVKKEGQSASRLSHIQEDAQKLCSQIAGQAYSEKALAMTAILRKISQNQEQTASLQRQVLSGLQLVCASLEDEQEARMELERIHEQMTQSLGE